MMLLRNNIRYFIPKLVQHWIYKRAETCAQEVVPNLKVWSRNSFKLGSFVFAVSDLDLTVYGKKVSGIDWFKSIQKIKMFYKFIGEINLYDEDHLSLVIPRMNKYELKRDPVLASVVEKGIIVDYNDEIEKIVFLLRLLHSDKRLELEPKLRLRKWQEHWLSLGFGEINSFSRKGLLNKIKELLRGDEFLTQGLLSWDKVHAEQIDIYHYNFLPGFSILFPHFHSWFEDEHEIESIQKWSLFQHQILKRQIDWEFWGIYTQRFYLPQEIYENHLERLLKVYRIIANDREYEQAVAVFALIKIYNN